MSATAADVHLGTADLELLLAFLPAHQAANLTHLIGCAACQELYRKLLVPVAAPRLRERAAEIDRLAEAVRATVRRLDEETEPVEAAVAELLRMEPDHRPRRIFSEVRFRTPAVACRLFRESVIAVEDEPQAARRLATLGLSIVRRLVGEGILPAPAATALEARGWALVARASWFLGDWPGVREALDHVERQMVEGGRKRRSGLRPAMRVLRLIERRLEDAVTVGAQVLHELLAPLSGAAAPDPAAGGPSELSDEEEN